MVVLLALLMIVLIMFAAFVVDIGALYLGQSLPVSGAQNTSYVLPGTYVAQVQDDFGRRESEWWGRQLGQELEVTRS